MPDRRVETAYEVWKRWLGIGLLLLGWIVTAAWFSSSFATRLTVAEEAIKEKVSRSEYQELQKRLDRIEDKLDKALRH